MPPSPALPLRPIRGASYDPLPNPDFKAGDVLPAHDVMQENYKLQWGKDGRDDLGQVRTLGGSAVRVYKGLGLEGQHDHGAFLDRAKDLGLHVFAGYQTQLLCNNFNCYNAWKLATKNALSHGFSGDKKWHEAVSMLILQNEPDGLNFVGSTPDICPDGFEAYCRLKAAISAIDGVLSAEREAGINQSSAPNMTIAWSWSLKDSVDGKVKNAPGFYGFQDIMVGLKDVSAYLGERHTDGKKSLSAYKPASSADQLLAAFEKRWTHSMNVKAPFDDLKKQLDPAYGQFEPTPWFISEFNYPALGPQDLTADLKEMDKQASDPASLFMGVFAATFQVSYDNPGDTSGWFSLEKSKSFGKTSDVCEDDPQTQKPTCNQWTIYCLSTQNTTGHASVVASAWGGKIDGVGRCKDKVEKQQLVVV